MKDLISDLHLKRGQCYPLMQDALAVMNFYKDSPIESLEEKIEDEQLYLNDKFNETKGMLFEQIKDILWEIESKPYNRNADAINFMLEQMSLFKEYAQRIKWLADIKSRLIQINGDNEDGTRYERKILTDSVRAYAEMGL